MRHRAGAAGCKSVGMEDIAYLTTAETSALLGVPARTLEKWRLRADGPPFLKHRGTVRYRPWVDRSPRPCP